MRASRAVRGGMAAVLAVGALVAIGSAGAASVAVATPPSHTALVGSRIPTIPSGRHAVSVAAGLNETGVVLDDGTIAISGTSCGVGTYTIPAGRTVQQVALGDNGGVMLLDNGTVQTWGTCHQFDENPGVVALPSTGDPAVQRTATQITRSDSSLSAALLDDGEVYVWGNQTNIQPTTGLLSLPTGRYGTQVSAAITSVDVLLDDGEVYSYGLSTSVPGFQDNAPGLVTLPAGRHAVSVGGGFYGNAAVLDDGSLFTWGWWHDPAGGGVPIGLPGLMPLPAGRTAVAVDIDDYGLWALLDDGEVYTIQPLIAGGFQTGYLTSPARVLQLATTFGDTLFLTAVPQVSLSAHGSDADGATLFPGDQVTVTGSGLRGGLEVDGSLGGADGPTTTTNADGTFQLTLTIPSDAAPTGGYIIAADVDGLPTYTATVTIGSIGLPTISGVPSVGSELDAVAPAEVGSLGYGYGYQWFRNGQPIAGATQPSYWPVPGDLGQSISVRMTGSGLANYADWTRTSAGTVITDPGIGVSGATVDPTTARVGDVLAANSSWAATVAGAGYHLSYQWYIDGSAVKGATKQMWTVSASAVARKVTFRVTASKKHQPTVSELNPSYVDVVAGSFAATLSPVISGTVQTGKKLTVAVTAPTPTATRSYQWLDLTSGAPVPVGSNSSSFTVPSTGKGHVYAVVVFASRPGYRALDEQSATTAPALGTLTAPTPKISGTAKVGHTLTVKPGSWTAGTELHCQWFAATSKSGALVELGPAPGTLYDAGTACAYTLSSADKGKYFAVKVSGTLAGYAPAAKTSARTAKVG